MHTRTRRSWHTRSAAVALRVVACTATLLLVAPRAIADEPDAAHGDAPPVAHAEGQPLAANIKRLAEALAFLGAPLDDKTSAELADAVRERDAARMQQLLDPHVLLVVSINPESRVKVARGPAEPVLQQAGYMPVLVKVLNESTVTKRLRIASPQAGPPYAGASQFSLTRQQQTELNENENAQGDADRFLAVEMYTAPPLTERLSGLEVEYAIALIYGSESGKREARIAFDVGQGSQDLGFRGEVPVLFDVRPAVPVRLDIADVDGRPTVGRLIFRDGQGRVYPPQARRLAPDFFFQPQVYRRDGDIVLLPPGTFTMQYSRGPEYKVLSREMTIEPKGEQEVDVRLERWVAPAEHGFFSGDHHIHAAGCAHYTSPTEGVSPADIFLQVKGEGLNVGCVLTWGPCFQYQRQFFAPKASEISDDTTVLKYDLEISGFGSQALGHVCLLNLKDQTYPGSDGTSEKGWPTWTTPVMRWAKEQGGVAGYAHSASGLEIDPKAASERLIKKLDGDGDGALTERETASGLLPEGFGKIDADGDGKLSMAELIAAHDRAADQLPNLAVPEMNGVGAMEICVSASEGVCDFISAMDTARIQEWNTWYHLLNCGFPIKVSGETDFPCMSSRNVGQGRVYVHLGDVKRVDLTEWCRNLAAGRSYVSDGYAHALDFRVNDVAPGYGEVALDGPGKVAIVAKVAFAPETPRAVAQGLIVPEAGRRKLGDTVLLHGPRSEEMVTGGERLVEIVVNGQAIASKTVPADGQVHDLHFEVPVEKSSWIALRQFPQMHTNPVNVIVADKPIRASRASALWCVETIDLLWTNRARTISADEREEARQAFDRARAHFLRIAEESPEGS